MDGDRTAHHDDSRRHQDHTAVPTQQGGGAYTHAIDEARTLHTDCASCASTPQSRGQKVLSTLPAVPRQVEHAAVKHNNNEIGRRNSFATLPSMEAALFRLARAFATSAPPSPCDVTVADSAPPTHASSFCDASLKKNSGGARMRSDTRSVTTRELPSGDVTRMYARRTDHVMRT
ncbi:hypothetical protein HPB51_009965 [Rhipicephalus microplus]|uniref:Uncharacterized protein n=1 Tax=Rhipicephalus microplus TaxID=6941 RepID=A0A9J6ET04_RHIMP|nr:hypothetical protein HPB51_009965 [Rhipicephalus microplus]